MKMDINAWFMWRYICQLAREPHGFLLSDSFSSRIFHLHRATSGDTARIVPNRSLLLCVGSYHNGPNTSQSCRQGLQYSLVIWLFPKKSPIPCGVAQLVLKAFRCFSQSVLAHSWAFPVNFSWSIVFVFLKIKTLDATEKYIKTLDATEKYKSLQRFFLQLLSFIQPYGF